MYNCKCSSGSHSDQNIHNYGGQQEPVQPFFSMNSNSVAQRKQGIPFFQPAHQIQRKPDGPAKTSPAMTQIRNSTGKGKSLSSQTLKEMNASFGTDFSQVNVHTDRDAVQMNEQLNAQAFTYDNDIYFNIGKYNPVNAEGKQLLAHELTHVMQQGGGEKMVNMKEEERFCPNADVNDAIVQSLVNNALASAKSNLNMAFSILRTKREQNCCDVNLAAAEHYMYARLQVAEGDWSFYMITLIILYDFVKFLHLVPKTGDCPITRSSWAQIRWASQGAVDGEMDYHSNPR